MKDILDGIVITDADSLLKTINKVGFLPMFSCGIPGFSLDEHAPEGAWDGPIEGSPWGWKDKLVGSDECAYGKFFMNRVGFVSKEWFPKFANYRRDGYDFDSLLDDDLAYPGTETIYSMLEKNGAMVSVEMRKTLGLMGKDGGYRFEKLINWLQMHTYVIPSGNVYRQYKNGRTEDFGILMYDLAERVLGEEWVRGAYSEDPADSKKNIIDYLVETHPGGDLKKIEKLIK